MEVFSPIGYEIYRKCCEVSHAAWLAAMQERYSASIGSVFPDSSQEYAHAAADAAFKACETEEWDKISIQAKQLIVEGR